MSTSTHHYCSNLGWFQSQFLRPNMTQSSWNQNSYLNIKLGEQLSLKAFIFLTILVKLYLVKMCPIFASSTSNCLTRYKQILFGCSLGCKNALNFTCLPMKFHNRVHTNPHYVLCHTVVFLITVMVCGCQGEPPLGKQF